jgi:hypothetical protein
MNEIQRGDPRTRRLAVLIFACGTAMGVTLLGLASHFEPAFGRWVEEDLNWRVRLVTAVLVGITSGPALVAAVYLWRLGERIRRAERYPPPNFAIMHDTPILAGAAARRRARLVQAFATFLCAVALLLGASVWRLVSLLVEQRTA